LLTGPHVILVLKVAVVALSLLLLSSFVPLVRGNTRLHGQINFWFFLFTLSALVGLELLVRLIEPSLFDYFDESARQALLIHLCFSLPAAVLLPAMFFTGRTHRRRTHLTLAGIFGLLWAGTVITGVFFLPHGAP